MNRRRALTVIGAAACLPALPLTAEEPGLVHAWRGQALGAEASLLLAHPDSRSMRRVLAACLDEIVRLERIFSLHLPDSELALLNREGRLIPASQDLRIVLSDCRRLSVASGGAFDATVQPLWRLYASYFAERPRDVAGPPAGNIERMRARIDYRQIETDGAKVAFARPGMAATLNGIAQGYITDRIADLLRSGGFERVLVQLGETRALGPPKARSPWRVGLSDPARPGDLALTLAITEGSVATSSGIAGRFDPAARYHHLLDPTTGRSATAHRSVSVMAPTAALADGLSTALAVLPMNRAQAVLKRLGGFSAHYLTEHGWRTVGAESSGELPRAPL